MKNILVLYYRCWCTQIAHKYPVTKLKRRALHPRFNSILDNWIKFISLLQPMLTKFL